MMVFGYTVAEIIATQEDGKQDRTLPPQPKSHLPFTYATAEPSSFLAKSDKSHDVQIMNTPPRYVQSAATALAGTGKELQLPRAPAEHPQSDDSQTTWPTMSFFSATLIHQGKGSRIEPHISPAPAPEMCLQKLFLLPSTHESRMR